MSLFQWFKSSSSNLFTVGDTTDATKRTGPLPVTVAGVAITATGLGKAEDDPHTSGDVGIQMLGVRRDVATAVTGSVGDYSSLIVTQHGYLGVAIASTGSVGDAISAARFPYDIGGGQFPLSVSTSVFNGSTWDRLRTPIIFKTVSATATGSTAAWTPAGGKKFRLMRFKVQVTANATLAGAAVVTIALLDAAADMLLTSSVYIPAAATALTNILESDWIDLGNGFLSSVANNVLNANLSAALTAGSVRLILSGTEE